MTTEEATEEADLTEDEFTPYRAITHSIINLRIRQRQLATEPNPHGTIAYIDKLIAALELTQWELGEYKKLKAALATLRAAMV